MRVRTAKQRAQRIDLNYFKHAARPEAVADSPVARAAGRGAAVGVGVRRRPAAERRTAPGPVSSAHAFAEMRCEVCHTGVRRAIPARARRPVPRAHDRRRVPHVPRRARRTRSTRRPPPACATCHQEHRGRVQLAKIRRRVLRRVPWRSEDDARRPDGRDGASARFPSGHPEFAAVKTGAQDPGRLRFNHAVHLKDSLRGPTGPEKLECATCHKPEVAADQRAGSRGPRRPG